MNLAWYQWESFHNWSMSPSRIPQPF